MATKRSARIFAESREGLLSHEKIRRVVLQRVVVGKVQVCRKRQSRRSGLGCSASFLGEPSAVAQAMLDERLFQKDRHKDATDQAVMPYFKQEWWQQVVPQITCTADFIKVCLNLDLYANATELHPVVGENAGRWLNYTLASTCAASRSKFNLTITVGGDGDWKNGNVSFRCFNASYANKCQGLDPPMNCNCNMTRNITPFAALPTMSGPFTGRKNTKLYCFNITLVKPIEPNSTCGKSNVLDKVIIWANDTTYRSSIKSIALYAAGDTSAKYVPPSWNKFGSQEVKATGIGWTKDKANGGAICLELDQNVNLSDFCIWRLPEQKNSCM
ncbi:hypothetical protein VOLCADRAFT_89527 [Volvox carteri f. nagariensis]|uniref:Pherophorin domain-containing protein n=1 Tax=Volvox carteri f. nagariensis TaxID=3068 RepID=D8TS29_VOLCA|nr:uncharacterized protein VOLCADRAFT_89527 [Volvox carteri f. nagariensis]EFJ49621.1 hypothetical protein VOLCADRAFT_89527 [Volvox carteri f. nagariensis]|eukprot:XP_002949128.1 hypothetical protein VOLCADRAFT_89527 [Volvox carteri f. nagariensis]